MNDRRDQTPLSAIQWVQEAPALRTLNLLLLAALAAFVFALAVVPWQQNVPGSGRIVAFDPFDRVQTIAAPVGGRVQNAWVIEGSRVEKGERLLEIVDNDPSILARLEEQREALVTQIEAAKERVEVYQTQTDALRSARGLAVEAAQRQVDVARADIESARFGREAARAAEQQALLNFERQRELAKDGLASKLEFEIAEREYRERRARVEQAQQRLTAARHDEEGRHAERGRIDTEASARIDAARASRESAAVDLAALRERLTALDVRIAQQNTQLITAPRAGTVLRLFAAPGAELVSAGDPLLQLVPETEGRAAELWVNGNDVPLITPGRAVRLQFEGWPAVQFSGWPSVAVGTFGGRVALVDPSDDGRGRFRILVTPDPDADPWPERALLRQGVRTRGFVLLEQVSLGFELWRQLNGFPPTVALENVAASPTEGRGS